MSMIPPVTRRDMLRGRRASRRTYLLRRTAAAGILVVILIVVVVGISSIFSGSPKGASSTPSTIPVTTTTVALSPVTLTAVGDMDMGNTPNLAPNASTYFSNVIGALKAPIEFGNLEGTLTDTTSGSKCGANSSACYAFKNPPQFAQYYRAAGFNVLNSANNHSSDFGSQGVVDTAAALKAAGITQAGMPGQIGIITEGTSKIAFCDFAPYPSTNNLLDPAAESALIAKAKTLANIVVVYMHAGAEGTAATHVTGQTETYYGENRGNAEAFAHSAIDDGAALVIASGPHVDRAMEWYKNHLIAYSLGDFASYNNFSTYSIMGISGILRVQLSASGQYISGSWASTVLAGQGQPAMDPANQSASLISQLSRSDFGANGVTVAANGTLVLPASAQTPNAQKR